MIPRVIYLNGQCFLFGLYGYRIKTKYKYDSQKRLVAEIIERSFDEKIIGPKWKYIQSLCSAFGIKDISQISNLAPTKNNPITNLTDILSIQGTKVLWTYHAKPLQLMKLTDKVLEQI